MITSELDEHGVAVLTFWLEVDPRLGSVSVVGDFNDWDSMSSPMTPTIDNPAVMEARVRCVAGCRYEFRYLSDSVGWFDDENAPDTCTNPHGGRNSIICTPVAADVDIRIVDLVESDTRTQGG